MLKAFLATAVLLYAALACLAWAAQERLLFYPRPERGDPRPPAGWRLERIHFTAPDGTLLSGVLLLPPGGPAPLLVYFGGNAEEVTEYAADAEREWGRRAVLLMNYRGYGASGGSPGEVAIVADARAVVASVASRPDVDGTRIALHGRSLGSAVAVQVAAAMPVRCVVLSTPLASALDVARTAYPWLPVSLLMRHPFDAVAAADNVRAPALVLIGTADTLVPPSHSERLAAALAGPVDVQRFEGRGHNDIQDDPRYGDVLKGFLAKHH